jgi:hypothetical protein
MTTVRLGRLITVKMGYNRLSLQGTLGMNSTDGILNVLLGFRHTEHAALSAISDEHGKPQIWRRNPLEHSQTALGSLLVTAIQCAHVYGH